MTDENWVKIMADNWRGRNGNSTTGDSVRNSCADELEKVAARYHMSAAAQGPSGCICQDQHRRGYCTEPGCSYSSVQPTQGAPKTIMEAAASAADKISLWSNSKQGYANRIVPQPTQGGDKGEVDDLLERLDDQGLYSKADRIQMIKDAATEIRRLHGIAYSSRTWDAALSERVMQFETAGVYKLSCKQILGLIAFVRDGEGSVVTSIQCEGGK